MSSKNNITTQRVVVYIDGFNLYFGLKSKGWKNYYWLDVYKLAKNILTKEQTLVCVKYFTSRISFPPEKVKRQGTFIEALETIPQIKIYYGNYKSNKSTCRKCGKVSMIPSEKIAAASFTIGRKKIADSLFPNEVEKRNGYILKRPERWR